MKRTRTQPITGFFQRKSSRVVEDTPPSSPSVAAEDVVEENGADKDDQGQSTGPTHAYVIPSSPSTTAEEAPEEDDIEGDDQSEPNGRVRASVAPGKFYSKLTSLKRKPARKKASRDLVPRLLQCREVGVGLPRSHGHCCQSVREREQLLCRALVGSLKPCPVSLGLPDDWVHRLAPPNAADGRLASFQVRSASLLDQTTATCLEFDKYGALLVAGSNTGVIAVYDFDEHFHRSMNAVQTHKSNLASDQASRDEYPKCPKVKPIHLMSTWHEVRRIRWNPLNMDEIAVCYASKNEIHLFQLQKFPTRPQRFLRASSRPSSGYNDLVFLPPSASSVRGVDQKSKRSGRVVAGDSDGVLRLWDLGMGSPNGVNSAPVWRVTTGKSGVSAVCSCSNARYLVCGTESGHLMTYDVQKLVVPALGSRPSPQRKSVFSLLDLIKEYLPSEYASPMLLSSQSGDGGVVSIRPSPVDSSLVIVQLKNDWLVSLDHLTGKVSSLFTFLPDKTTQALGPFAPATVLPSMPDRTSRRREESLMRHHRCSGAFFLHQSFLCAGLNDSKDLQIVDLRRLPPSAGGNKVHPATKYLGADDPKACERLDRVRIPMDEPVTAVAAHPTRHALVCAGYLMNMKVLQNAGI